MRFKPTIWLCAVALPAALLAQEAAQPTSTQPPNCALDRKSCGPGKKFALTVLGADGGAYLTAEAGYSWPIQTRNALRIALFGELTPAGGGTWGPMVRYRRLLAKPRRSVDVAVGYQVEGKDIYQDPGSPFLILQYNLRPEFGIVARLTHSKYSAQCYLCTPAWTSTTFAAGVAFGGKPAGLLAVLTSAVLLVMAAAVASAFNDAP